MIDEPNNQVAADERNNQVAADDGVIELRLHDVNQFFDALDPSPFNQRELNGSAEEYLVESVAELPSGIPREIVIYIKRAQLGDNAAEIGSAIRDHFARRSLFMQRSLRRLLKRGAVSLIIGLLFLTAMFVTSQALGRLMGEQAVARIVREGLVIIGWVAMWKPLEILLYEWWPILSERRLFDRLSRIQVRIVDEKPG